MNKKGAQFLQQYPQAAKVYLGGFWTTLLGAAATIKMINGEKPVFFREGTKRGFFLLPGANMVDCSFQKSSYFVFFVRHRYSGDLKYNLTANPGRSYSLTYSFKTQDITFQEKAA